MLRILELKAKSKRTDALQVLTASNGEVVELHPASLLGKAYRKGDSLTEAQFEELKDDSARLLCRDAAWRLISHHPRSETELLRALRKRRFVQEIAQEIVADLAQKGFINDEVFAATVAQEQVRKRKGRSFIRRDLQSRGVDREIVEQIVQDCCDEQTDRDNARQLLEKWNRRTNPTDPQKRKRAAASFLVRRGFSSDIVYELVREILGRSEEE